MTSLKTFKRSAAHVNLRLFAVFKRIGDSMSEAEKKILVRLGGVGRGWLELATLLDQLPIGDKGPKSRSKAAVMAWRKVYNLLTVSLQFPLPWNRVAVR
jgi:hypothetical protein